MPSNSAPSGTPAPAAAQNVGNKSTVLPTAALLTERLDLEPACIATAFQSRFGRERWIGPETAGRLRRWGKDRLDSLDVICPGFAADCLETLEEIAIEGRQAFLDAGGQVFHYIECLNESAPFIDAPYTTVRS